MESALIIYKESLKEKKYNNFWEGKLMKPLLKKRKKKKGKVKLKKEKLLFFIYFKVKIEFN